jgi:hypothetical protein
MISTSNLKGLYSSLTAKYQRFNSKKNQINILYFIERRTISSLVYTQLNCPGNSFRLPLVEWLQFLIFTLLVS